MMRAVRLHADGRVTPVTMDVDASGRASLSGEELFVHLESPIALLSTCDPSLPFESYFGFQLPPPLNFHVYPEPLFACRMEQGVFADLDEAVFVRTCNDAANDRLVWDVSSTVYDVAPAEGGEADGEEEEDEEDCELGEAEHMSDDDPNDEYETDDEVEPIS